MACSTRSDAAVLLELSELTSVLSAIGTSESPATTVIYNVWCARSVLSKAPFRSARVHSTCKGDVSNVRISAFLFQESTIIAVGMAPTK